MMAKASTKPIMFQQACERVAKRLDVDDIDYAERRLCQELARDTIEFGRDWFASQVEPEGADVTGLWQHFGYTLVVDRNMNKATFTRVGRLDLEDITAQKIRIAPAVINALVPVARRSKSTGQPREYDIPGLQQVAREIMMACGFSLKSLAGEGGLIEQVIARVGESAVPTRSRAVEIFEPIWDELKPIR
jgi:hypothetical protein